MLIYLVETFRIHVSTCIRFSRCKWYFVTEQYVLWNLPLGRLYIETNAHATVVYAFGVIATQVPLSAEHSGIGVYAWDRTQCVLQKQLMCVGKLEFAWHLIKLLFSISIRRQIYGSINNDRRSYMTDTSLILCPLFNVFNYVYFRITFWIIFISV